MINKTWRKTVNMIHNFFYFLKLLLKDFRSGKNNRGIYLSHLLNKTEVPDTDENHLRASIAWLLKAQSNSGSQGGSLAYSLSKGWMEAYPETTGYIICTLIEYYGISNDNKYLGKAIEMGDWETGIQLPEGSVRIGFPDNFVSDVFDTGMVLLGYTSLYSATREQRFLNAAENAANWLIQVQDADGKWSSFSYRGIPHVYHSKVSWALYKLFVITENAKYRKAADSNIAWIMLQKQPGNWFNYMAFTTYEFPYTHTIAYTLQGFIEIYKLQMLNECVNEDLYRIPKSICDTLIKNFNLDMPGSATIYMLPGTLKSDWSGAAQYTCLTGNAQMAIVFLNIFQISNEKKYYDSAINLINSVKMSQKSDGDEKNNPVVGAIPGSYPIWGAYHPNEYPNWAVKFFADALMLKIKTDNSKQ